jgi:hypothetical protein
MAKKRSLAKYTPTKAIVTLDGKDPFLMREHQHVRSTGQHEADLLFLAERYAKGWTIQAMTDELNSARILEYQLSYSTVKEDIEKIHKRWIVSYLVDFNQAKANELAHIDSLEQEYWNAWRNSQRKLEEVESEKTEDKQGNQRISLPNYSRSRVKKTEKSRDGNVDFLKGVQWCIEQRCKILGITMNVSTQNINVSWRKEAEASGVDPEGALNELVEQFVTAATVGGEGGRGSLEQGN